MESTSEPEHEHLTPPTPSNIEETKYTYEEVLKFYHTNKDKYGMQTVLEQTMEMSPFQTILFRYYIKLFNIPLPATQILEIFISLTKL